MPSDHIKDYYKWFSHQKEVTRNKNARKFRKFCHWLADSKDAKDYPEKVFNFIISTWGPRGRGLT